MLVVQGCDVGAVGNSESESGCQNESENEVVQSEEVLFLCYEEALFLHSNLHCLEIFEKEGHRTLDTEELWGIFCSIKRTFPQTYVTYFNLRKSGWIVRSGLKFGADFSLYEDDPDACHSKYSIIVKSKDEMESFRWSSVISAMRIQEKVAKKLALAVVELSPESLHSAFATLQTSSFSTIELHRTRIDSERDAEDDEARW